MEYIWSEPNAEQNASTSICDVAQGIRNMGNNPDLFRKHFNKFKENSGKIVRDLDRHISNSDYSNASILCHSIKGLSGMLGLTTLHLHMKDAEYFFHELAQQLEHAPDALIHAHKQCAEDHSSAGHRSWTSSETEFAVSYKNRESRVASGSVDSLFLSLFCDSVSRQQSSVLFAAESLR